MLDTRSAQALAGIVRRESRSLLAYTADAFPWATAERTPAVDALRDASALVGEAVSALGRHLAKRRVTPPMLGAYPTYFTYCNFLSVDWWLPRVLASEKGSVAALEAELKTIPDAEAKKAVVALIEAKKLALARLEALSGHPAAA
jgi:hypothetical protein